MKLKIRNVGGEPAIAIPKRVLERLRLAKGDTVFLTEFPNGFRITRGDPEFEEEMTLAGRVMKKRIQLLRELAK